MKVKRKLEKHIIFTHPTFTLLFLQFDPVQFCDISSFIFYFFLHLHFHSVAEKRKDFELIRANVGLLDFYAQV